MKKIDYKILFINALTYMVENELTIDDALNYLGVTDLEQQKEIIKIFNNEDEEQEYYFESDKDCANVIGKALDLPYIADAYDSWSYEGLLSDLHNCRGEEWLQYVIETNNKGLIKAFKEFIHYRCRYNVYVEYDNGTYDNYYFEDREEAVNKAREYAHRKGVKDFCCYDGQDEEYIDLDC